MLEFCITHPEIFDYNNVIKNREYLNTLVSILNSINQNGIIIVDNDNRFRDIIKQYILHWPKDDKGKKVKLMLKELINKQKIVECPTSELATKLPCQKDTCSLIYEIRGNGNVNTIVPNWCKDINNSFIKTDDFMFSNLHRRLHVTSRLYDKGDEKKFEDEVLIPIVKYSKIVKIIDRYFGDSMKTEDNINFGIKEAYKKGFEYILRLIKNYNVNEMELQVELYTSFKYNIINQSDRIGMRNRVCTLQEYIKELNVNYNIDINIKVMESFYELPHERYIFTNQSAVQIGRGLDFFDNYNNLRDMNITWINKQNKMSIDVKVNGASEIDVSSNIRISDAS